MGGDYQELGVLIQRTEKYYQENACKICIHGAHCSVPEELHLLSPLTAQRAKAYQVCTNNAANHALGP